MMDMAGIDSDAPRDADYYRGREMQERESAERADSGWARNVHLAMAERYAAVVCEMTDDQLAA